MGSRPSSAINHAQLQATVFPSLNLTFHIYKVGRLCVCVCSLTSLTFPKGFSSRQFSEIKKKSPQPSPHPGAVILGTLGGTKLNNNAVAIGFLGNFSCSYAL